MCLKYHYFKFNFITKDMLKLYPENKNGILAPTLVCFSIYLVHENWFYCHFLKMLQINPEKNKTSF